MLPGRRVASSQPVPRSANSLFRQRAPLSPSFVSQRRPWASSTFKRRAFLIVAISALLGVLLLLHQHAAHAIAASHHDQQQPVRPCEKHPRYWRDDPASATRTPYNKSPSECYRLDGKRKHSVAITTLLPDTACPGRYSVTDLLQRLSASIGAVLVNNPADVVLFHAGWTDADLAAMHTIIPRAQPMCIATEHWVAHKSIGAWEFMTGEDFGAGYRSMCRWYSVHIFEALELLGYEWVIRIDDDSVFPSPIPYNLVAIMEANGAHYGYRADSYDASEVTHALPEAASYWLVSEGLRPTWLLQHCSPPNMTGLSSLGWAGVILYNNFFVTRVAWWTQPRVRAWLYFLLELNGFYKFRWGDAPVHTVTTGMLMSDEAILQFGFEYEHQRFNYALNQFTQHFFANVVFNATHGGGGTPAAARVDVAATAGGAAAQGVTKAIAGGAATAQQGGGEGKGEGSSGGRTAAEATPHANVAQGQG